jgi:hypothetical protein
MPHPSVKLVLPVATAAVLVGGLCAVGAAVRPALAAPNYSSGEVQQRPSQLRVVEPRGGTVRPGEPLRIEWRKSTAGTAVSLSVHAVTAGGDAGAKVRDIVAPASVRDGWKAKGGALLWTVPRDLPAGRYLVQVRTGTFVAVSEIFTVKVPDPPRPALGPEQLGARGRVIKVDVEERGARGSVVVRSGGVERTFDWGRGSCPELGGGLPGALAMMATLDDAEISPRFREASLGDQVQQRCIVGLVAENKPVPGGG